MSTSGTDSAQQLFRDVLRRQQALRRHRSWRIGVLVVTGALATFVVFTQAVHYRPVAVFFFYVVLASWYGDVREAMGSALFGLIVTLVLLPDNARLGFSLPESIAAELLFAAACLLHIALVQSLRKHRILADAAVRTRDEFLTAALHDLRNPLTSMLGRAELIQRRLDSGKATDEAWLRSQMAGLCGAATRMLSLVNEFGDVARLELGKSLDLQREVVDVSTMIRAVAEDLGRQHGVAPVITLPPGALVVGDRARLERMAENIVGNAFKYSTSGTPVHLGVAADTQWVTITVRDSGVGIPADELPRIFTRYFRASTAAGITGSGLGLAGAKAIVEEHGGRITVQSAAGRGTMVTISLPRAQAPRDNHDQQAPPAIGATPGVDAEQ